MVILNVAQLLAEAEGGGDFQLHFRSVFRVPTPALGLPVYGHGKGIVPHQFLDILPDAAHVAVFLFLKGLAHLVAEFEANPLVHHRLTTEHIPVVFHGDVDVREDLPVRLPAEAGTGFLPVGRAFFQTADVSALFKMQIVAEAVSADSGVEIFRGILGSA